MSSVHQFHESLNSLKAPLTHLKQQCVGDFGGTVFKNLDISQIIFKFKRESNRQDQVERNKRAVIHELNTLSSWELPTYARRFREDRGEPCPTSLKLFWQLWFDPQRKRT